MVHCAAFFRGATPEQAQAVNELGTQHLASAARAASVKRFVFTSTGLVYGSNGGRLAREDDPCAPTAAYPVSKLGRRALSPGARERRASMSACCGSRLSTATAMRTSRRRSR